MSLAPNSKDEFINAAILNKPIDVPTADTVSFIRSHVRRGGAILEIGCGSGHVAAELAKHGYDVVGIDSDLVEVSKAQRLGVKAVHASWSRDHDHDLHTVAEMTQAIEENFVARDTERVPYLYRYLVDLLPETPQAVSFLQKVFSEELRLGKAGAFSLIGRRMDAVAR